MEESNARDVNSLAGLGESEWKLHSDYRQVMFILLPEDAFSQRGENVRNGRELFH